MKSILFQGESPFIEPPGCSALPCRQEVVLNVRKFGRVYQYVLRDSIVPEDLMMIMVKATAFAIQTGEPYNGTSPARAVKDFLIKGSVVI